MLNAIENLPDGGDILVFLASRGLNEHEQQELRAIADNWLQEWHEWYPECPVARSQVVLDGRVVVMGIDAGPRSARGIGDTLTGSDLDSLYHGVERFASEQSPELTLSPNAFALIVKENIILAGREWWDMAANRMITEDTPIFHPCTVAEWRAGRFVHRLGDDPEISASLLGKPPQDVGVPS